MASLQINIDASGAQAGAAQANAALTSMAENAARSVQATNQLVTALQAIGQATQQEAAALTQSNTALTQHTAAQQQATTAAQAHLAVLQQRLTLLSQVRAGTLSLADADRQMAAAEIEAATGSRELAAQLSTAQSQVRQQEAELKKLQGTTETSGLSFSSLTSILAGFGVVLSAQTILAYADQYRQLDGQLKLVTSSSQELTAVHGQLLQIAQRTGQAYDATVQVYARAARAQETLGIAGQQLLNLTEGLNLAVRVSGATGAEAAGGLLQLSQAFQSGALQGDEFRSVSESLPNILTLVAKEMGVTRGELKQLGSEGKITGDILASAITNNLAQLREEASKLPTTAGQAFTVLSNALVEFIGNADKATGSSSALADMILALAKNIDTAAVALAAFTSTAIIANIGALTRAFTALNAVLLANPWIVLATVVAALGVEAYTLIKAFLATQEATKNLSEETRAAQGIFEAHVEAYKAAHGIFEAQVQAYRDVTDAANGAAAATQELYKTQAKASESVSADIQSTKRHIEVLKEVAAAGGTYAEARIKMNEADEAAKTGQAALAHEHALAQSEEQKYVKIIQDHDKATQAATKSTTAHATAVEHQAEAQAKALADMQAQTAIYQQVAAGLITMAQAQSQLAAAQAATKTGSEEEARRFAEAKAAAEGTTKALENEKKIREENRRELEQEAKAREDARQEIQDNTEELNKETAMIKAGIAAGKSYQQITHEIAVAQTEAALSAKGVTENVHALAEANVTASENLKKSQASLEAFKDSALLTTQDLKGLFDQVFADLLDDPGKIADDFANFGKGLGLKLIEGIAFGKQGLENNVLIPNFSNIFGEHGLIGSLFSQSGQQAGTSFIDSFLNGARSLFGGGGGGGGQQFGEAIGIPGFGGDDTVFAAGGTAAGNSWGSAFGVAAGVSAVANIATSFSSGNIGAGVGGLTGAIGGAILGGPAGAVLGSQIGSTIGSFLDSIFGGLFAHTPTKGTQIRKGVKDWLSDIGVSFSEELDTGNYFFNEAKDIAKRLFGGDFLEGAREVLKQKAGPELAAELTALGVYITEGQAQKLGKDIAQTGTTFGNMLIANLGIDQIPDAIDEIIQKSGITFEGLTTKLTKLFQDNAISTRTYTQTIQGAVDLFYSDLPKAINVAAIAQKSFTEEGTFDLEAFQKKLKETTGVYDEVAQAAKEALLNSEDGEDAAKKFGEGLKRGLAQLALDQFLQDFITKRLFEGIDLSDGLSQEEIDTMKERVRTARDEIQDLRDALKDVDDASDDAGDGLDDVGVSAQELTDKIIALNRELEQIAQKRIDIRLNLIQQQQAIGVLSTAQGIEAQRRLAEAQLGTYDLGVGSAGKVDLSRLSDTALQGAFDALSKLGDLTVQQFNNEKAAIEQGLQDRIEAINTETQAAIDGINQETQATIDGINERAAAEQDAIRSEFEAKRQGIQDTIDMLQEEKSQQQELTRARIDALNAELRVVQQFAQVAQSLSQMISGILGGQPGVAGFNFLQRQAAVQRGQLGTPESYTALATTLQQQLQAAGRLFSPTDQRFINIQNSIIDELKSLQDRTQAQGNRAAALQEQIAAATDDMQASLASIDTQIKAQQKLSQDLSKQESAAIAASQKAAAAEIKEAQRQAAADIKAAQLEGARRITEATNAANAEIARLRAEANQRLLDIYALQDEILKEQQRRAEAARQEAVDTLNTIKDNTAALNQIAADTENSLSVLHGINSGIAALNTYMASLTPAATGFAGLVTKPTLFLVGERGPEYASITPPTGRVQPVSLESRGAVAPTSSEKVELHIYVQAGAIRLEAGAQENPRQFATKVAAELLPAIQRQAGELFAQGWKSPQGHDVRRRYR